MGDTMDYIDGECEEWAEEIDELRCSGATLEEAEDMAGSAPLPDCYEYLMDEESIEATRKLRR